MSKESFDQKYSTKKLYWGSKPSNLVRGFSSLASLGHALDLGMGEGRDSIYLAQRQFNVTGVDHSKIGVEKCVRRAEKLGVKVSTVLNDVRDYTIQRGKYSLIVSNSLFQYVTKSEAQSMARHIIGGLKKGGIVMVSVFTYDDPRYKEFKKKTTELEPGTFLLVSGDIYSLYNYRELLCLFEPLRILYYTEYDYYHEQAGTGHWHGIADLVAKKQ
jgi:2-polyprenyl-3-methyl-5-hydroxy-6-metoxy-1,4-benzoquinol methylase